MLVPSLGMLCIMNMILLFLILSIIKYSMPPIYDDYNDESGFGRVSTLGSSDPTILEGAESYYDKTGFGDIITYSMMNPLF